MKKTILSLSVAVSLLSATDFAFADAISPGVHESDKNYSSEPFQTSLYGTGETGRLSEASAMRFTGEQLLHEGKFDQSMQKLAKAVQLDPGDPYSHILYARSISAKVRRSKALPSLALVNTGLEEWRMIWHHDADSDDQKEAKAEARYLAKLAKSIGKLQMDSGSEDKTSLTVAATRYTPDK